MMYICDAVSVELFILKTSFVFITVIISIV